ncbi:MAG: hypothetical protein M1332_07390 [Deltaproteobacteria bacterium]|nr:hypothetical protein [Deltaproteobacteria bacterium]
MFNNQHQVLFFKHRVNVMKRIDMHGNKTDRKDEVLKISTDVYNNDNVPVQKKRFIEPELREYPSLTEITLLSAPGTSGTFFKTFK